MQQRRTCLQLIWPVRDDHLLDLDFNAYVDGQLETFALTGRVASGSPALGATASAFPSFGVEFTLSKEQTAQLSHLIIERLDE